MIKHPKKNKNIMMNSKTRTIKRHVGLKISENIKSEGLTNNCFMIKKNGPRFKLK